MQHGEIEMGMGGTAQETDQTCTMAVVNWYPSGLGTPSNKVAFWYDIREMAGKQ